MSSQIDLLNTRIILFLRQLRKSKQLKLLRAPNLPKMQDLIYTSVPAFLSVGKNKSTGDRAIVNPEVGSWSPHTWLDGCTDQPCCFH